MTGPESPTHANSAEPARMIDGKYEVVREVARDDNVTVLDVQAGTGSMRRVAWFDIANPTDRKRFYAYRSGLRTIAPAGLTDIVARPGAYYAVWQPVNGIPLTDVLGQSVKKQETIEAVEHLAEQLAEHGFALPDADIVLEGDEPNISYLRPAPVERRAEDIQALNAGTLSALNGGRIRKKRKPAEPGAWLVFVPGLLFLGAAIYMFTQMANIYLNPPMHTVPDVSGKPAKEAAEAMAQQNFRIEFDYDDTVNVPIGAVIRQDPGAGTSLSIDRSVTLVVNRPNLKEVPVVENQTPKLAKDSLSETSFTIGNTLKVDGTVTKTPKGRIIAQIPAGKAKAQRGRAIQVLVSTGVAGKMTYVPPLRGMSFEQARENARAAGLVVTKYTRRPSNKGENIVLEQKPEPFVLVEENSGVTLVLSQARYSAPATPTDNIPLPPPPAPDPQLPKDNNDEQPLDTPLDPPTSPGVEPPELPSNLNNDSLVTRPVTFKYVFPADLPDGKYTAFVQDADGERMIMESTDANRLRGLQANSTETVRGNAVFVIRANGAEYERFNAE